MNENQHQKMKIGPENDETDVRADKFDNFLHTLL